MKVRYVGPVEITIFGPDGTQTTGHLVNEDITMHFRTYKGSVTPGAKRQPGRSVLTFGPVEVDVVTDDNGDDSVRSIRYDGKMMFFQHNDAVVEEAATPASTMSEQDSLLQERGAAYSDAWILTTEVLEFIWNKHPELTFNLIGATSYMYAWITILCKLLRAITSPEKADHWRDIAGYAILVAEHIETGSRGYHDKE